VERRGIAIREQASDGHRHLRGSIRQLTSAVKSAAVSG
jgi:hypothetical protein